MYISPDFEKTQLTQWGKKSLKTTNHSLLLFCIQGHNQERVLCSVRYIRKLANIRAELSAKSIKEKEQLLIVIYSYTKLTYCKGNNINISKGFILV